MTAPGSFVLLTGFLGLLSWLLLRKRAGKKRRMSFTSEIIAVGGFPAPLSMPEPIINAVVLYDEAPSPQDIEHLVIDQILQCTCDFLRRAHAVRRAGAHGHVLHSRPRVDAD